MDIKYDTERGCCDKVINSAASAESAKSAKSQKVIGATYVSNAVLSVQNSSIDDLVTH